MEVPEGHVLPIRAASASFVNPCKEPDLTYSLPCIHDHDQIYTCVYLDKYISRRGCATASLDLYLHTISKKQSSAFRGFAREGSGASQAMMELSSESLLSAMVADRRLEGSLPGKYLVMFRPLTNCAY